MSSTDANVLYCDKCINFQLAQLKKAKEQKEREDKLREEQEEIEYSRRIAQIELESFNQSRQLLRREGQQFAKVLEEKFEDKRKRGAVKASENEENNFKFEFEDSRKKYREELLGQINDKRSQKTQKEKEEREAERKRLEDLEKEKERSIRELTTESLIQKETYQRTLASQINHKKALRNEEIYQKQVEKALIDEEIRRYKEEQRQMYMVVKRSDKSVTFEHSECGGDSHDDLSSCSQCRRMLPLQSLSRFSSK